MSDSGQGCGVFVMFGALVVFLLVLVLAGQLNVDVMWFVPWV